MKRSSRLVTVVVACALWFVAAIRLLSVTVTPLFVLIVALAPLILLAAWLVILGGVLSRSRLLIGVGAVLAVLQVFWMLGEFGRSPAPIEAEVARAPASVRVASANVLVGNDAVGVLFESLATAGADIVLLQEITATEVDLLARTASWAAFPHRVLDARPGAHGSVILSRLEITDGGVIWPGGWPMTRAVVRTPTGEVDVINVHTIAPLTGESLEIWKAQFADLATQVQAAERPVVIAGDFNATAQHAGVGTLRDAGLLDAHLEAGWGWGATFPAKGAVPPLLRLDRILVSTSIEVTGFSRVDPLGSDHHPLIAELVLPSS